MNLPGYDAWKLAGPPDPEGPECAECGGYDDVRMEDGTPVCRECFCDRFSSLPTPREHAEAAADEAADHRREMLRDRDT